MKRELLSLEELFAESYLDPEFQKANRKIRPYYDILKQIVIRRREKNLTQKELAVQAKTHQSRISKIESAEHDIRLSTLIDIAEALDAQVQIALVPNNHECAPDLQFTARLEATSIVNTEETIPADQWLL